MPFNLNFIFVLLKFVLTFVVYFFIFEIIWIKCIALALTFFIIHILKTYPRKRFKKLSQLRMYKKKNTFLKYRLFTMWDHAWNISVLSSFLIIFILGFFLLRYFNMEKDIDLVNIYHMLKNIIYSLSLQANLINIILLLNIFLIYLLSFKKIISFYKFHIMKRHFYLINNSLKEPMNFYTNLIYFTLWRPASKLYDLINKPSKMLFEKYLKFYSLKNPEYYMIIMEYRDRFSIYISWLYYTIHYYILVFVLFYDLYFHNFHLNYFYKILPFVFIYDLLRKLCLFGRKLDYSLDQILKKMIYHYEDITSIDDEYFYFGESDFDTESIEQVRIAVNVYMVYDFNSEAVRRYEKKQLDKLKL